VVERHLELVYAEKGQGASSWATSTICPRGLAGKCEAFLSGSAEAEEKFKSISQAYSTLSDEASRRAYDERLDSDAGRGDERSFARGFSPEEAAYIFMQEMYALATELTMQNVGWRDIARRIEERRKAMVRGTARPYFPRSGLSGFFGLCLVSFFGGFGFLGLLMFLSGAYNLVRAIYFMTTGNAPRTFI